MFDNEENSNNQTTMEQEITEELTAYYEKVIELLLKINRKSYELYLKTPHNERENREKLEKIFRPIIKKFNEENSSDFDIDFLDFPSISVSTALTESLNQLTIFHGKAIDTLPIMNSREATTNFVGDLTVIKNNVKLVAEKFNSLPGTLSISTHKLLCKAISVFTEQNHAGKTTGIKSYEVNFPLKEYALQCGYDVEEHDTSTPEEAEQEKKRVKNTLDNFRKKVKKDLEMLYAYSLTWEEKVKGKLYDFDSMRIIGRYSIKKGIISVEFTVSMAEYMIQLTQTKYSAALFSIDDRKPNAYNIGWKMATHYNNDNNLIVGTANLLKVKTLLACTSLPDLETVRGTEHGWIDRIKEPFESALDVLTKNRVLADWRYSHSKGVEMTDTEATNFESYEDWANTLLYFELKDPHDHTERLARNADKKKEAKTKRTRKKKKSDE